MALATGTATKLKPARLQLSSTLRNFVIKRFAVRLHLHTVFLQSAKRSRLQFFQVKIYVTTHLYVGQILYCGG